MYPKSGTAARSEQLWTLVKEAYLHGAQFKKFAGHLTGWISKSATLIFMGKRL
jgi:hypothetical protein